MKIFPLFLLSFLLVTSALTTQQPPGSAPWDVTLQTNKVADSTLTVVNRCKKTHRFQIQLQNVPFLHPSHNQANVKGGQTQVLPVKFDTTNLAPGVYQGQVLVICATCKSELTCTQDREVLQVNLRVTPSSAGPLFKEAGGGEKPKEEEAKKAAPAEEPAVDGDFLRDYKSAELKELTRVEQIIDYFEGKNPSIKFVNGEGKYVTWNPCVAPNVIKKVIRNYYVNDDGSKSYNSDAPSESSQIWMENHSPEPGTRTGREVYWICAKP